MFLRNASLIYLLFIGFTYTSDSHAQTSKILATLAKGHHLLVSFFRLGDVTQRNFLGQHLVTNLHQSCSGDLTGREARRWLMYPLRLTNSLLRPGLISRMQVSLVSHGSYSGGYGAGSPVAPLWDLLTTSSGRQSSGGQAIFITSPFYHRGKPQEITPIPMEYLNLNTEDSRLSGYPTSIWAGLERGRPGPGPFPFCALYCHRHYHSLSTACNFQQRRPDRFFFQITHIPQAYFGLLDNPLAIAFTSTDQEIVMAVIHDAHEFMSFNKDEAISIADIYGSAPPKRYNYQGKNDTDEDGDGTGTAGYQGFTPFIGNSVVSH